MLLAPDLTKLKQTYQNRGCAYDVDYRNPKLCSKYLEVSYDLTAVDNAMYRIGIHG